jgi:formylglycine-generating enzyme required for sulfatase activity
MSNPKKGNRRKIILIGFSCILFLFAVECFWLRIVNDPSRFPWIYPPAQDNINSQAEPPEEKMVLIPSGSFWMGCRKTDWYWEGNENPRHQVTIKEFRLDKFEVTNRQYQNCTATKICGPSKFSADEKWNAPDQPVVGVSWVDAVLYCRWRGGRLPTEAEWEYAARAGTEGTIYDDLNNIAWYLDNSDGATHPVGLKKPNSLGLYDMLGNTWEWCADWYSRTYYRNSPMENPLNRGGLFMRVARGGAWMSALKYVRLANRAGYPPTYTSKFVGFRCAKD